MYSKAKQSTYQQVDEGNTKERKKKEREKAKKNSKKKKKKYIIGATC